MCRKKKMNKNGADTGEFIKGLLVGVAAVLAIGGLVALLTTRHLSHRDAMRPRKRMENYNPGENTIGDTPGQLDDPSGGVVDTMRAVNQALDTGRQAMETIHDVMEKIRGN